MVGLSEIFITVTAAGYLLGRKELPKVGKFVGIYCGRSVGAIVRAKNEFFDATSDHEIVKLQREFQKGIEELNDIRSELSSVGNMRRPYKPQTNRNDQSVLSSYKTTQDSSSLHKTQLVSEMMAKNLATPIDFNNIEAPTEEARLAIAEERLTIDGKFNPRIEQVEGGADYVAASIVDSMLLPTTQNDSQSKHDDVRETITKEFNHLY